MLNNDNKKDCGFSDEIVSYIYDEIGQPQRGKFESHLAGCTSCTDEFAGISNARFAMFEWRREEFAALSTPEIVIPYAAKRQTVETVGFFAGLRELIRMPGWPSVAMAAGVLAVCVGLGFVAMNYVDGGGQVAQVDKPAVSGQALNKVTNEKPQNAVIATSVQPQKESSLKTAATTTSVKSVPSHEIRPIRVSLKTRRTQRFNGNLTASTMRPQQKRKAPALTAYDDDEDGSLRLADLFNEVGSIRR